MNESQAIKFQSLTELHSHLYGCISAELLYEMGKKNPAPRWEIFTKLHSELYGEEIEHKNFFKTYHTLDLFKELYYFSKKAPFLEFQSKFNLIIALSKFDPEEIKWVTKNVVQEHSLQGVEFAEFRIMYSPFADEKTYYEKTLAACEGLFHAEEAYGVRGRLVVSLHRDQGYENQYIYLKKAMKSNELIQKYLVGIDFCNIEEGFPPKEKKLFLQRVLRDNQNDSSSALSILYHVGESFRDKTHLSACRWVLQASEFGAHRLGHCIALVENLDPYRNSEKKELASEYFDTLEYITNNYSEISNYGSLINLIEIKKIISSLQPISGQIQVRYTDEVIETIETFRKYTIHKLIKNNTIIESCPSSNYLIGMIEKKENLPIKKFVETNLKLTIGADDPGIFHTDLPKEYEICEKIGITNDKLQKIIDESKEFRSEIVSGRES